MKKLIALLLVLVMAVSLMACGDTTPKDTTPSGTPTPSSDPKPSETDPAPEAKVYTWDVTVVYDGYDAAGGEVPPVVTITDNANAENTLSLDPLAAVGAVEGDVVDFTPLLNEDNDLVLDGELTTNSAAFNEADWTVSDDGDPHPTYTFEVVTPLTEGDTETHGELLLHAKCPDYVWDVTVVFEPGTEGTYEFTNPGLTWGEPYDNQMNVVTPEDNTFELYIFNHSAWIVDNSAEWYQWVVFDVDDVCPYITYEIVTPLVQGDRATHGQLTITLSLS